MMPKTTNIIAEQRELSLFTLQTLYKVVNTLVLRIDTDEPDCVAVYYVSPEQISVEKIKLKKCETKRQEIRLVDIYHETYSDKEIYQIRFQNGDRRLISFDDGTFFACDDKYNYLAAFFYVLQHQNEGKKAAKKQESIDAHSALSSLEQRNFSPNIEKSTAWNEEYMKSLSYLLYILDDEKSERLRKTK